MKCPVCEKENSDDMEYCVFCGKQFNKKEKDDSAGCAMVLSGFLTVLFVIFAVITKNVANSSSRHKSSVYIFGVYLGQNSYRELYNTIFYVLLFIAAIMVILFLYSFKKNRK